MKISTTELEGSALNYAVALALRWHEIRVSPDAEGEHAGTVLAPPEIGDGSYCFPPRGKVSPLFFVRDWSRSWEHGGPLIEQHISDMGRRSDGNWLATVRSYSVMRFGSTPLIAACRALVASVIGEWAEIPDLGETTLADAAEMLKP